jgi:Fe-S cluster biogenesis protein NfuA
MFIQTEATPNPATLKFLPGREVYPAGSIEFHGLAEAEGRSPLAESILKVAGVRRVFFGPDFVTVTKDDAVDWPHIKPSILGAIMDCFTAGRPVVTDAAGLGAPEETRTYDGDAAEIVAQIKELLDTRVRPAVAQDGGDILFSDFDPESGVVKLHMRGACAGCPSSTMTLKAGIENMLRHYVPEVTRVEQAL